MIRWQQSNIEFGVTGPTRADSGDARLLDFPSPVSLRRASPQPIHWRAFRRLSANESNCLAAFGLYEALESRRPTYSELAISIGVSSRCTAEKIVRSLERKGFLERAHHAPGIQISKEHQAQP